MNRAPGIIGSVAGWAALAIVPAFLVSSGTIGSIDAEGNVSGSVFLTWLIGFLASLCWLYVVDKAVGRSVHWWFITGSILPWLLDFTAAFSPGGAGVLAAITGLNAVAMVVLALRSATLDQGTPVTATVVTVLPPFLHMNMVVNGVYLHRRVLVQVPRPDGTTYQAKVAILTEIGDTPSPGDQFPVLVDPKHPTRVVTAPSAQTA